MREPLTITDTTIDVLLDQYLAEELSVDEVRAFDRWIAESSERTVWIARMRAAWVAGGGHAPSVDGGFVEGRAAVLRRIREGAVSNELRPSRVERERMLPWREYFSKRTLRGGTWWHDVSTAVNTRTAWSWSGYALVTVLVLVLGLSSRWLTHPPARQSSVTHTYRSGPGHRTNVRLADGSMVLLAPSTSVTMTNGEAKISGEAQFTIVPRSNRPFIVRTTGAIVRVLGTRFIVRHYEGETESQVVVEDGRVALQANMPGRSTSTRVLSARMLAVVSDSGIAVTTGIVVQDYIGWTQEKLVFNSVSLGDAVKALGLAYRADIRIEDSALARQKMRMEVSVADLPLSRVLDIISDVNDAHVVRHDTVYVISPGRSATQSPSRTPGRRIIPHRSQPEQQYGK